MTAGPWTDVLSLDCAPVAGTMLVRRVPVSYRLAGHVLCHDHEDARKATLAGLLGQPCVPPCTTPLLASESKRCTQGSTTDRMRLYESYSSADTSLPFDLLG